MPWDLETSGDETVNAVEREAALVIRIYIGFLSLMADAHGDRNTWALFEIPLGCIKYVLSNVGDVAPETTGLHLRAVLV